MADNTAVLGLLYANLGYKQKSIPDDVKTFIESQLAAADARLMNDGVDISSTAADITDLRVMYAAYLYRHRDSDKPMPRSLRLALNDAKVAAATIGGASG